MTKTLRELEASLQAIAERNNGTGRSLDEYLRSVYGLAAAGSFEPSYDVFADILARAFVEPPVEFNPQWMETVEPPDLRTSTGLNCLLHQLEFLISDLRRLRDAGTLKSPPHILYGGVDSPTGYRWYNLEPCLFLKCAGSGAVGSAGEDADIEFLHPDWTEFASILDLGRDYE